MKLKRRKSIENLISWGHQEQLLKGQRLWAPLGEWGSLNRNGPAKTPEENGSHRLTYVHKTIPPYALKEKFSLNFSVQPMRRVMMLALEWRANISAGVRYNHKSVWAERTSEKVPWSVTSVQPCFCVAHWRPMATKRWVVLCQTEVNVW